MANLAEYAAGIAKPKKSLAEYAGQAPKPRPEAPDAVSGRPSDQMREMMREMMTSAPRRFVEQEQPSKVDWPTSLGVSAHATKEGILRALYNMGRAGLTGRANLPPPEDVMSFPAMEVSEELRPIQSLEQNVVAGAMGLAPYFVPAIGQTMLLGDIGMTIKDRPEAAGEIGQEIGRSFVAPFSEEGRERFRTHPVENLANILLPLSLLFGGLRFARGAKPVKPSAIKGGKVVRDYVEPSAIKGGKVVREELPVLPNDAYLKAAKENGVRFDGMQKLGKGKRIGTFTDPETGTTFYARPAEVGKRLAEKRAEFEPVVPRETMPEVVESQAKGALYDSEAQGRVVRPERVGEKPRRPIPVKEPSREPVATGGALQAQKEKPVVAPLKSQPVTTKPVVPEKGTTVPEKGTDLQIRSTEMPLVQKPKPSAVPDKGRQIVPGKQKKGGLPPVENEVPLAGGGTIVRAQKASVPSAGKIYTADASGNVYRLDGKGKQHGWTYLGNVKGNPNSPILTNLNKRGYNYILEKQAKKYGEFFKPSGSAEMGAGSLGSPGGMARERTEARMEAPAPKGLVGRPQIVDYMRDKFKIPFRVGKFRNYTAAGIYKTKPEVVRTRVANDLSIISHELGHHLEKKIYGGFGRKSQLRLTRAEGAELLKLGKALYGSRKPHGGYHSEGFAEYISHWLTTEKAGEVAPGFHKFFENRFLKENPDIAKDLHGIRKLAREYYNQGAIARVKSNIGATRPTFSKIKEKSRDALLRINTLLADDLAPLEFVEKKIRGVSKLDPRKVDPLTSPTMLARTQARTASSKAREMVLHGTFNEAGKQTGKSMRDALAPVVKDLDDAMTYSYARRALEVHSQGKDPGITKADARYVIDNIGTSERRAVYEQVHKDLTAFENRVMDYLVEAGGMTKEVADVIMKLNPTHIPLKRVVDNSFVSGGRKMADLSSPVKRMKGSGLPIHNIYESIIENTTAIINYADKVRVGRTLIELAEKEGVGKWIEKIPAPVEATRFSLGALEKQLREAGIDLSSANMEQVLTVYSNAGLYKGRDNIVSFWRGGKREFYEIDKRLYSSLKAMDEFNLGPMADFFFGLPARTIRLGATGLNAGFGLITNPIRDAFTFALQTEYSRGTPDLIARSLTKKVFAPNNKMNTLFRRSGVDMSQFLGMDRKQLKKAVSEVTATTATRKAWNVVEHPIEALKDVFSITEASPRLAEFKAAYREGEKIYGKGSAQAQIMGSLAGSDVTVNFKRAGAYGKYINQIIPFWNAQVQGVLKFGRFAKDHPVKAGIKAVAGLTIPTIGIWMLNKDEEWYRESPSWLKYGFWNIPVGKNKDGSPAIVRIPRPFEWGIVFSGTPEMVLDYWYSKDPAVIKDGLSYMAEQTIPVGPDYIPPTLKIPVELWANYDFFRERDIVPHFEFKYKEPKDQYGLYTTETSKFIGRQFGLSPRKIDHLISSATGGLGHDITMATEQMLGYQKPESNVPANLPVIGRLFARTQTSQKSAEGRYYERQDKMQRIKNKIRTKEYDTAREMIREWNRLNAGKRVWRNGKYAPAAIPSLEKIYKSAVQGK